MTLDAIAEEGLQGVSDELSSLITGLTEASAGSVEERKDTRERLLAAAMPAFASDGFKATTIRSLAAAVKITPGAVYAHFDSKEAILSAALARAYRKFLLDVVVPQDSPGRDARLKGLCRRHIKFQMENRAVAAASDTLLMNETILQVVDPNTVALLRQARASYYEAIRAEVAQLRSENAAARTEIQARAILVLCDSASAEPRPETASLDPETVVREYLQVIWHILGH
ncbi:TetR/AcrR family transcriptional regulator [Paenarthrobacter sp. 2TAF44]|uniref:TetR/AcrR family transcriptional regulator n=1 Tax=Paenarthrobacter sp. 2TAF44 TaxID=3233018 RepID=UPI003F9856CB